MGKVNLNLILILAVASVILIPIVYGAVEPSIIINMDAGQTTKPFLINNENGTEVFSVATNGTISPSQGGGGEVFTWTANHSSGNNDLILGSGVLQLASTGQTISDFFGDIRYDADATEAHIFRSGGTTEFVMFPAGNGARFELFGNQLSWNIDSHNITPTATSLIYDLGASTDRHIFQTNDIDRFTVNSVDAQVSVPFDFNSNAITEAVIDCSLNTCTNFPSGTSTTMIAGNHFGGLGGGSGDRFFFPSGQSDAVGNETEMIMVMTTSGTIDRLFVKYIEGGGNSLNVITTVTVRKNLADTSLSATIPAGSTALVNNTSSSFTFVAGDEISIKFGIPSGTGAGSKPHWSFEITQ